MPAFQAVVYCDCTAPTDTTWRYMRPTKAGSRWQLQPLLRLAVSSICNRDGALARLLTHASVEVAVTSRCFPLLGLACPGGRADAHPGADGEERQHERPAGQWQRLSEQLSTPCQGPTPRDSADGQGLQRRRLRQGEDLQNSSTPKTFTKMSVKW